MRGRAGEMLLSVCALLVLLGALVAFDPRVRDEVGTIVTRNGASSTATALTTTAGDVASALVQGARDQSLAHAPLLIFGAAAAVLVTFMLRT